ncbi:MarR family transcriptional regulator [uncultured Sphingomonas sp.]|uniref:MarR family winged helix-turn-helix transcriptional regulator n=1 Tax=uncultured Sphingomonas sp. TaxID=158754 RepID=UPI00262C7710|nr:MarR family transcriptional regulator [uncultured Sphingomonas sp.]
MTRAGQDAGKTLKTTPSIPFRISWIARLQTQRFDVRAKDVGLTRAQWRVIATIAFDEGAMQSDVASRLEVANVTAGRIIDRLEEMQLIERRADPADRRANRLYLTAAAGPVLERLTEVGAQEEAAELKGLSNADRALLTGLLDRMIANMVGTNDRPVDVAIDSEGI